MFFGVSMIPFFTPVSIFRLYFAMSTYAFGNDVVTITIRVYTFIVFIALIEFVNAFKCEK